MLRKNDIENSQRTKRARPQFATPQAGLSEIEGVGDNHLAWEIIIPKLDYQSQLKMSFQSQRLHELIQMNAESDLRKFRRHIKADKFM